MMKKNNFSILIFFFLFCKFSSLFGDEGISTSKWLNRKMENKPVFTVLPEKPKKNSVISKVEESSLGNVNLNSIGLISAENTTFPASLWNRSDESILAKKITEIPELKLASTNKIFKRLLILDTEPPINAIGNKNMGSMFLISRVDRLIEMGAIDEAETILDYIKNPNYDLLTRKIDIASITGRLQGTCKKIRRHFKSSDILKFKIICLAREGDWNAAAILFSVGSTLKLFSSTEKKLLLNFLDPEINVKIEEEEMKENLSPINFYLLLSRGSIFNTKDLPPKYAYNLSLVGNNLMERIQSSEKLVKNFSMNSHHLFSLYRSAGQADESTKNVLINSVVNMDNAFKENKKRNQLRALKTAINVFYKNNLLPQFAKEYESILVNIKPTDNFSEFNDLIILLLSLNKQIPQDWLSYKSYNDNIKCILDIRNKNFSYSTPRIGHFCKIIKEVNFFYSHNSRKKFSIHENYEEVGIVILESLKLLYKETKTKHDDFKLSMELLKEVGQLRLANEISTELIVGIALEEIFRK